MVEVTLFEFNVESVDFTANAPFSAAKSSEDLEAESDGSFLSRFGRSSSSEGELGTVEVEEDGGRPNPLPVVVGLGLLVLFVVLGRRIVGGEPEPVPQ